MELLDVFYYRVGDDEDMNSIAKKFNVSRENIERNNADIPLYSGEIIRISRQNYISHFVAPMETIDSIARTYDVDSDKLLLDNNLSSKKLFIGQEIRIIKD